MKIRVGDFKLSDEEKNAVIDVLNSNNITESIKTRTFEQQFSKYINVDYTVLVNSGTSALLTALSGIKQNIKIKDSFVITTPLTYIADINAIELSGFKPIFIDVNLNDFNISSEKITDHLENEKDLSKYSTIMPVHLMGYPADMDKINKIKTQYNLYVIEDSAQAHGSLYNGKKCGSMSDISTFSFYVAHNIQVGEMGAICTNDLSLVKFARRFKANGRYCDCTECTRSKGICPGLSLFKRSLDPRFYHIHIGYNFKTTDIMASIGLEQLKKADKIKEKRYNNVKFLNEELSFIENIIKLPLLSADVSYLAYPLIVKNVKGGRGKITSYLEKMGIETRPLFTCIPFHQPSYQKYKDIYKDKLKNAEYLGLNGFYIGCHQFLSENDLKYIVQIFKSLKYLLK